MHTDPQMTHSDNDTPPVIKLGKDTLFYGGTNLASRAVSVFLVPIFTRIFTPSEYGVLELLLSASALLSRLLSVGVDAAFLRFYNDLKVQDRRRLAASAIAFLSLTGIPVCIVLSLLSPRLSGMLFSSRGEGTLLTLMLLSIPFIMIGWIPQDLTRLTFQKWKYNVLAVGGNVFYAITALVLVLLLHLGLWGIMFSHLLRALLFVLLGLFLVRSEISLRPALSQLGRLLRFGGPLLPATVALWVSNSSDRFFLAKYASLDSVGVYSVANRLAWIEWFLFSSFQMAYTPIAYSIHKRPEAFATFRRVFVYFLALSSLLGVGVSLFSRNILAILAPETYGTAYAVVGLLNLSIIFHALFYIVGIGLSIAEKTKYFAYSYVIGAVVNVALNMYLIPRYEAMGAAIATLISFGLVASLGSYWSGRYYPLRLPLRRALLISILFLFFWAIGILIEREGGAVYLKTLALAAYTVMMLFILGGEDRRILLEYAKIVIPYGRKGQ